MKRVVSLSEKVHGNGPVRFSWQKPQGCFIATAGVNNVVNIYDRHGEAKEQVQLQGRCVGLAWDKDGDILAMISDQASMIVLWDANTFKVLQVDVGFKEPMSVIRWSSVSENLAAGTSKGNLVIYSHLSSKKTPVLGKHSKRVSCVCWSRQDLLAMASEDKTLTISNKDGDTLQQINLRAEPSLIQFSEMKQNERVNGDNTVSLVLGKKILYLFNLNDPENPMELAFQQKYGEIVSYRWFGDGYILLGFSFGYFIVISTYLKEIGQELHQSKNHKISLNCVDVNAEIDKAASCGDNTIKIYELSNLKETYQVMTVDDEQTVDNMEWTSDGQLLAVSSAKGALHIYLTKLPMISHVCQTRIIYLSSLLEVTVTDYLEKDKLINVSTEVEPSFLSIGPYHFALGMNNRAWFYSFNDNEPELGSEREYLGTIQFMTLNADYSCVLYEGKLHLHLIDMGTEENKEKGSLMLPELGATMKVTCQLLTLEFLIYGTDSGIICYFQLEDWQNVTEYRHSVGVRSIYSEPYGLELIFIDNKSDGFIFNPVNSSCIEIPDFPRKIKGVLWDRSPTDENVFMVYDEEKIYIYYYLRESIRGYKVDLITSEALPKGQTPLLLYAGELTCQTQGEKLTTFTLSTHEFDSGDRKWDVKEAKEALKKCTGLKKFKEGWRICQSCNSTELWTMLAVAAVEVFDLEFAIEVYRQIKEVGMVWTLEELLGMEDQYLLAGNIASILGDFELAQELFLKSSRPSAALDLRRDLLQWDIALQLANKLAPEHVAIISKEYAQQLELMGEYSNALTHYENAVIEDKNHDDHNASVNAGIARMAIRCGQLRRGVIMAEQLSSRIIKKECAEILEEMKQYTEASALFESGGYSDRAASLYIRLKNWQKVGDLLPLITSPKILLQYAKAKEADGRFQEAAEGYRRAKDHDNLIRILLEHLKNPEEAVELVRETQSIEGAKMVARFFQKLNDFSSAIQFLVMSRCNDEAFELAKKYGKMAIYAEVLGKEATDDEFRNLAFYYENEKSNYLAGKYFYLSKDYPKALKQLLKVSGKDEGAAIHLATDAVGKAQDSQLTQQLIRHLLGEADGVPKEPKYLFKLYMACGQYKEAAKTATIIAREEQNAGSYRNAHDLLFSMYRELLKNNMKVSSEMQNSLMILHSYILVKLHVKLGNHLRVARLLIRVANNISKFPAHVVPIITSTIIECHRSGLKNSAFNYATMLMRPDYRNQIDAKYKRKIEAIVRKPQKVEEEEPCSPCPFCNNLIPEMETACPQCKNSIPYCVITGQHIVVDDLTECPSCSFPAVATEFSKFLEQESTCPMCAESVKGSDLKLVTDAKEFLKGRE
ncbi:WD repeat-containing protein 19 [Chamberlinius hualienensis]